MSTYLRTLGVVLLVLGIVVAVLATRATLADDDYYRAASALERHSDHIIYQAEYQAALARHAAYIITAVVSAVGGIVGSATLFGISAVLQTLSRRRAAPAP